ncbi:MAG: PolC-type DNA polymerase III [Dialister sp.]|nr:PolC-type DNA polymerase III [Dialister sp.]
MGKYRLQIKNKNIPITLLEVDTECSAWCITAEDERAAVEALRSMGSELAALREITVNGRDVTGDVLFPAQQEAPEELTEASSFDVPLPKKGEESSFPGTDAAAIDAALAESRASEPLTVERIVTAKLPEGLPDIASVMPVVACSAAPPAKKKMTTNILIGKKPIKGKPIPIGEIKEERDNVIIAGTVIRADARDLRGGKKLLVMSIADDTNGIWCKKFFDRPEDAAALDGLHPGVEVKVRGHAGLDKYTEELTVTILQMERGETKTIEHDDDYPTPRVELHLHTKMSLDGLIDNEEIIKTAKKWKHPAVAITDHGVIQSFPKIQELAAKYKQKVIYGMEGYMIEHIPEDPDQDRQRYDHIIILAKNMTGLRNLYRMVTLSHLEFYRKRPLIPKPILEEMRDGLIYGSACVMGEFFRAVLDGESDEQLIARAKFYDYLEVQPLGNNEFLIHDDKHPSIRTREDLERLNKKVIEIGEAAGVPVCATSDAHYLFAEDSRNRDILLSNWEKPGRIESHPPVYVRTTREMLDEFSYIPKEKAIEIVVTNTREIASRCEVIEPLAPEYKSYNPKIAGADQKLMDMCYANARAIYGDPLPKEVDDRLKEELTPIINHGYGVLYYIAHKLVKSSNDRGYLVGSRGSVGSSFAATMAGITEVNPLPPHYVCPHCHYSQFFDDGSVGGGFDLKDKACPKCGHALNKDGHNIPFAVFLGFDGDKVPDIDLNFSSGDDQGVAHKYTEELFGRDNVFRAGTIAGIQDKTAFGFVKKYAENRGLHFNDIFIEKLSAGVAGVKRTTGQHPAGIMVCPRDMDIHNFTPLQYAANKKYIKDDNGNKVPGTITTHFDYHSISGRMLKLDILGHEDPKVIRMLQELTHIDPLKIPFDDPKVLSLFSSTEALGVTPETFSKYIMSKALTVGTIGLPEFGTPFVRGMLEETRPKNFSELVRISGFSHGTNVWLDNARDLIQSGRIKLEEAISTRDDIMNYLIQHKVTPITAFKVMENVRKGKGLEKGDSHNRDELEKKRVPRWFIESCLKIGYLFPRAHAVAYVMMAFRVAWFKVYYPLAYYAAYFTIRAEGSFNAPVILKGLDAQKAELARLNALDRPSAVDKSSATVIEVAAEMYLRGFEFLNIDLNRSAPSEFLMVDGKLLPPFNTVPALGNAVAGEIVKAREDHPFTSKEDLKKRGKVSQAIVDTLEDMGVLKGLPDEEQISLFSL